jgi:hypothetical protein
MILLIAEPFYPQEARQGRSKWKLVELSTDKNSQEMKTQV